MNTRSPYFQYDDHNEQSGRNHQSPRDSTSNQTYTTKKNTSITMKGDLDLEMGERGRTRSRRNLSNDRRSDVNKNSDSYYSDEYENTTYGSERSPTPSSKSRSPRAKKTNNKLRSITPIQRQGVRKVGSKFPSSKRSTQWGFRSRSLNKESSPKDIDLVTRRVLSARLLKINELRNELSELQIKLEELQKENKTLKRLQFRQEKALNKFEDTENEISQLISRHNNEMRTLRERLRKSQERERNTEKKLKDTEDELYRTSVTLKKLKQLAENKHLAEREDLTKKLDILESKMEEREKRIKDLEKNIELTQSSYQRQLLSEKKKAHEVQEMSKSLQEELQKLTQKLKEKEKELDVKNIYAYRLSKPPQKKETEITPRRKVTNQRINTKSVQTTEYASSVEFTPPPPPPPVFDGMDDEVDENQQAVLRRIEQENIEKQLKEEAERLKKERDREEWKREQEEKQIREKAQKALEEKAKKLRDEWEKDEFERKKKEKLFQEPELEKEDSLKKIEEERIKKELLLAKMFEIDHQKQDPFYSDPKIPTQTALLDSSLKLDSAEKKQKMYKFSESTEKLFNGLPVNGRDELSSKTDIQGHRIQKNNDSANDFSFGNYSPSFGKGRSNGQKTEALDDAVIISNSKINISKEKRSNLMEQLFGNSSDTSLPSISKTNESGGLVSLNNDQDLKTIFPWEKNNKGKMKDDLFLSDSSKNTKRHTTARPLVKAVDSLEDEIEEVVL
ncbi:lebercilin [Bombina bombina]|uniref:lebercilin n=1 Tax=Bombina bombina TaxID=8345 RepID=UPI00235AD58E|nr:lebercilin [Bombina bombina]